MLDLAGDALGGDALGNSCREDAVVHAVLAVVFHVAAGQRAAVDVHGVALPVGAAGEEGFVADHHAHFLRQLHIEGSRKDGRAGPHGAAVELQGSFIRASASHAHGRDGVHAAAVAHQVGHFLPGQLVHEGFPLLAAFVFTLHHSAIRDGQVEVHADHILNLDLGDFFAAFGSLRPGGGDAVFFHEPVFIALIHVAAVGVLGIDQRFVVSVDGTVFNRGGLGLLQAGGTADHVAEQAVVDGGEIIHEQSGDFIAGGVVLGALDAVGDGVFFRQHLVMGIAAGGDFIAARFQLIANEAVSVGIVPVK